MHEGDNLYGDVGFEGGLDAGMGGDEAGKVWEKKYVFVKAMVPGFVNEDFGKKVCWSMVRADGRSSRPDEV